MILTALWDSLMAFAGGFWILPGPLFLLLLIGGIVLLASRSRRPPSTGGGGETGIDILDRRLAEGELSLEEYRERRSTLEESR